MNKFVGLSMIVTGILLALLIYVTFQYDCTTEFTAHGHPIRVCVNGDTQ